MPNIEIYAGKGGVGKTTCATAKAVQYAHHKTTTAIIDFDGGHSVYRTLGKEVAPLENKYVSLMEYLHVAVISPKPFKSIVEVKEVGGTVADYLKQFPEDKGVIALNDMCRTFFGLTIDVDMLQKTLMLLILLKQAESLHAQKIIIDVEPTAGLQRMLAGVEDMARSLRNLSKLGFTKLALLGAKWPDLKQYLAGDYIALADQYAARLEWLKDQLVEAKYQLVCIAEMSPAQQTFNVREIIEGFGGSVNSCVVNRVSGFEYEDAVFSLLSDHSVPMYSIAVRPELHEDGSNKVHNLLTLSESCVKI